MNIRARIRSHIHFPHESARTWAVFDTIYPIEIFCDWRDDQLYVTVTDVLMADHDEFVDLGTSYAGDVSYDTKRLQASIRDKAAEIISESRFYRPGYSATRAEREYAERAVAL